MNYLIFVFILVWIILILSVVLSLLFSKNNKVSSFSPATAIQIQTIPSHNKKYSDPDYYYKNYEDMNSSKLGPLSPLHILSSGNVDEDDPNYKTFEHPFTVNSLEQNQKLNFN